VLHILGLRFTVPNQASATARALESEFVGRLARFFPDATPVRIPVRLSRAKENGESGTNGNGHATLPRLTWSALQETVIEFGTPNEVLFAVACPLEFADHVLVESRDGTLHAEASIVAVQYHPERTVVAARFLKPVSNWIVKS